MTKGSDNICDFIEPLQDRAFENEWERLQSFAHIEEPLRAELRNLMRRAERAGMYETDFIDLLFEAMLQDFRSENPHAQPKDRNRMVREHVTFLTMGARIDEEIERYGRTLARYSEGTKEPEKQGPPPVPLHDEAGST